MFFQQAYFFVDFYEVYDVLRVPPQAHLSSGQKSRKTFIIYLNGGTDVRTYDQTDGQMN